MKIIALHLENVAPSLLYDRVTEAKGFLSHRIAFAAIAAANHEFQAKITSDFNVLSQKGNLTEGEQ